MWEKKEGLLDGAWVLGEKRKATIIMFCYGSYQPNFDENIGALAWVIQFTDTDIY